MKVHQVVFLVLLSALCPVTARFNIFTGATGGNGSITCNLAARGDRKYFCRDDCKGENVLVETHGVRAVNGRFSVSYREVTQAGSGSGRSSLTVTIRNLTKSDSARYRCGVEDANATQAYAEFGVRVVDDPVHGNTGFSYTHVEGENFARGCSHNLGPGGWKFFCRGSCRKIEDVLVETNNDAHSSRFGLYYVDNSFHGMYVMISNLSSSDTGWYKCGYGSALNSAFYISFPLIVIPVSDPRSTESPQVTTEEASDAEEQDSTFPTGPAATESPHVTTEEASDAEEEDNNFPTGPSSTESPHMTAEKASAAEKQRRTCPSDALVYVVAVLVIIIVVLGLALIFICSQRKWRSDIMNTILLS